MSQVGDKRCGRWVSTEVVDNIIRMAVRGSIFRANADSILKVPNNRAGLQTRRAASEIRHADGGDSRPTLQGNEGGGQRM